MRKQATHPTVERTRVDFNDQDELISVSKLAEPMGYKWDLVITKSAFNAILNRPLNADGADEPTTDLETVLLTCALKLCMANISLAGESGLDTQEVFFNLQAAGRDDITLGVHADLNPLNDHQPVLTLRLSNRPPTVDLSHYCKVRLAN